MRRFWTLLPAAATGVGVGYNTAQLVFAAFAPDINNALFDLMAGSSSTPADGGGGGAPPPLYAYAAPAIWVYVGWLATALAFVGVYYGARSGALARISYIRDERF